MASQALVAGLYYSAGWHSVSVRELNSVVINRGDTAEVDSSFRPALVSLTLGDRTTGYTYDPDHPLSPLYGIAGRNTPLVIQLDTQNVAVVEATEWQPDRTEGFIPGAKGDAWVEVSGGGILQRIAANDDPLRSPMERRISSLGSLLGYWPGEDGSSAASMSNVVSGGYGAGATGVTFGGGVGPPGSDSLMTVAATSIVAGRFATASTTTGWQASWVMSLKTVPSSATLFPLITLLGSNGYRWVISANNTSFELDVINSQDTVVYTSGLHTAVAPVTSPLAFMLKQSISGTTITYELDWYQTGAPVIYFFGTTFTGNASTLSTWNVTGNTVLDGAVLGHVYATSDTTINLLSYDSIQALAGYEGELAGDRFTRLCTEEGITSQIWTGVTSDTTPMGPQQPDTLQNLLLEIRDTDDALIFDTRDSVGLTFRKRTSRYNQAVWLALTYPGDLSVPLTRASSDTMLFNDVTVQQREGGYAHDVDSTSALSVQAPPAGVGRYKRTVNVNVADDGSQLTPLAGWWRNRGTVPGKRYAVITIDLVRHPEYATAVSTMDPGARITIDGLEPDQVSLEVIGWTVTVGTTSRVVSLTCARDTLFNPGIWDDSGSRYDVRGSTVGGTAPTTTATAWTFTAATTDDEWSTTSEPYDLVVAGERITVTTMNAATGTGPYTQTATVTRHVNGIVKAHATGEPVHLAAPARYAL